MAPYSPIDKLARVMLGFMVGVNFYLGFEMGNNADLGFARRVFWLIYFGIFLIDNNICGWWYEVGCLDKHPILEIRFSCLKPRHLKRTEKMINPVPRLYYCGSKQWARELSHYCLWKYIYSHQFARKDPCEIN
jgi:hypothetical protein